MLLESKFYTRNTSLNTDGLMSQTPFHTSTEVIGYLIETEITERNKVSKIEVIRTERKGLIKKLSQEGFQGNISFWS